MKRRRSRRGALLASPLLAVVAVAVVVGAELLPRAAAALEPLPVFLESARGQNFDNRAAVRRAARAEHEAQAITGEALPSFDAQGKYTRNQFDVSFQFPNGDGTSTPFVISPQNQWDALLHLEVPLVDLGAWGRASASKADAATAAARAAATALEVERQVVSAYYDFAGLGAVVGAAEGALAAARENLRIAGAQRAAGAVAELDVQQARAEVATDEQQVASAELQHELARRRLTTLTGHPPAGDQTSFDLTDDLHEEAPLVEWEQRVDAKLPQVAAATAARHATDLAARAAKLDWLPSFSASADEHLTNATAFSLGHSAYYALMATANWKLDFEKGPHAAAESDAAALAENEEDRARAEARDAVHEAWWKVHATIAESRAAASRAEAAHLASDLSRDRYQKGVGTQLESVQALRDGTSADVGRIRAAANLAAARAALRLSVGAALGARAGASSEPQR